jgi:hypothetical protein
MAPRARESNLDRGALCWPGTHSSVCVNVGTAGLEGGYLDFLGETQVRSMTLQLLPPSLAALREEPGLGCLGDC